MATAFTVITVTMATAVIVATSIVVTVVTVAAAVTVSTVILVTVTTAITVVLWGESPSLNVRWMEAVWFAQLV